VSVAVEFMPGRVAEVPAFVIGAVPTYVVCRLQKLVNGSYALMPEKWSQMVRLTPRLHEELGLPCSYKALYYLARAGFVEARRVTPRCLMLDLVSVLNHFERCRVVEGEPSWWTAERVDTFRNAREAMECEEDEAAKAGGECEDERFRLG